MAKTNGGPGTNQYRTKGQAKPKTPPPGFAQWPEHNRYRPKLELAEQPEDVWVAFTSHPNSNYRANMAQDPACPVAALELMVDDSVMIVREAVAGRTDNPAILAVLAGDSAAQVQGAALKNPYCPPEVVWQALKTPERRILIAIASRPDSSAELLHAVAVVRAPSGSLAAQILLHPNTSVSDQVWLFDAADHEARIKLCKRPTCSPPVLSLGAADGHSEVREAALSNHRCPPEDLARWAKSMGAAAQTAVRNPNCPSDVIIEAIVNGKSNVRDAALGNPAAPPHLRAIRVLGR